MVTQNTLVKVLQTKNKYIRTKSVKVKIDKAQGKKINCCLGGEDIWNYKAYHSTLATSPKRIKMQTRRVGKVIHWKLKKRPSRQKITSTRRGLSD